MLIPSKPLIGLALLVWGILFLLFSYYLDSKAVRLTSLNDAIHDASCVWAFWYVGSQLLDNIIEAGKPTSIKKMILLKPSGDVFNYLTKLAGEDSPVNRSKDITDTNAVIEIAKTAIPKVDIYYHSEQLTYSFTIFDKKPKLSGNNLLPNSKNAWVVIQPIEPKRARPRKDWHKWVVRNKGNTRKQFDAYYQLFLDIENRAEQIYGDNV